MTVRHLRADYDRIQDPDGLIPEDEPVFLIRGQDPAGAHAVLRWAEAALSFGSDLALVERVREWAVEMERYAERAQHGAPDVPNGMLR